MSPRSRTFCLLAAALLVGACGDDDAPTGGQITDTVAEDAADTSAPEDTAVRLGPVALVYPVNPVDTPELVEVELRHLVGGDGSLVGDYARVRGCVADLETGQKVPLDLGGLSLQITLCTPTHLVRSGDDGSYLHVTPPATPEQDDGRFAEVMMYHHMQQVHDYFKGVHGLTDRDEPLDALVNLQAHIDLCDEWARLPNAAFIPHEALDQLPLGIELDLDIAGDAIVFSGSATKNFAFDASVIYHEYTHAILGATRLNAAFLDDQGVNNLPGALNEAYADYFASALTGLSAVGNYSLNGLGSFEVCGIGLGGADEELARDMSRFHTCPDDLTAEVHADSEIFSSALWKIRQALGAVDADRVILDAVLTLTNTSDFTIAAEATVDAADALLGPEAAATVRQAFDDRGIIDCPRVLPVERVGARGLPVSLPGVGDLGAANPFDSYAPGYLQYSVEIPPQAQTLVLTLELAEGGLFGGLPGGGGGAPELAAAFKRGDAPIAYATEAGAAGHDAEVVVPADPEALTITLSGDCLVPGAWTFALHNGGAAAGLRAVTVTTSNTPTESPNFDGCGAR